MHASSGRREGGEKDERAARDTGEARDERDE